MKALSIVYAGVFLICMHSCKSQTNKVITPGDSHIAFHDSLNKPEYNVKVNKEFDSKGNLIRYDSTYSYVYKSGAAPFRDSLFLMKDFFGGHLSDFFNHENRNIFFDGNPLFKNNFFDEEFFRKQSELNQRLFKELYPKNDSLRNKQMNYTQMPRGKSI